MAVKALRISQIVKEFVCMRLMHRRHPSIDLRFVILALIDQG